jgi:hypothetical protein
MWSIAEGSSSFETPSPCHPIVCRTLAFDRTSYLANNVAHRCYWAFIELQIKTTPPTCQAVF